MSMLPVGIGSAVGGYQISRSLRFNSADSAYLNRTPASAGNRKTWTWSGWVKRSDLVTTTQIAFGAYTSNADSLFIYFSSNQIVIGGYSTTYLKTTAVYRDPSAWYMVTLSVDTSQATASNRFKLYVNGTQVTAFAEATYPSQNTDLSVNATYSHTIGAGAGTPYYYSGYLTEINFIDGQALTPSSFGETDTDTGVWKPKKYTGSYSGNSFYLNFSDNSGTTSTTLGKDSSGLGNNWTPNNFSVTAGAGNDSLVDTPTPYGTDTGAGGEVRGNYSTFNALDQYTGLPLTNGNIQTSASSTTGWNSRSSTVGISSGKWYVEFSMPTITAGAQGNPVGVGIIPAATPFTAVNQLVGDTNRGYGFYCPDTAGNAPVKRVSSSNTSVGSGSATSTSDVFMVAFDLTNGNAWFGKNGTWYAGDPAAGTGASITGIVANTYVFATSIYRDTTFTNNTVAINFGQRPFAYTAPSGFKALCTQNLPEPTIVDGGEYFNTVLYTGNGSTQSITGVGFQPDFVWIKGRSGATDHGLYDSIRGVQKQIETGNNSAETTETTGLTAFGTDGFTVGSLAQLNTSSATYVAWNWKANGAGSSNTAGTITSTVSVNTTSGFSIVTYTGTGSAATVGHGLGVAPRMIIIKTRSNTGGWAVYHASFGNTGAGFLNGTNAWDAPTAAYWNNTTPTSSVFTVGTANITNNSAWTFVAYCFAPVAGYSAISSFTGNGSADGPFIFTNHRPAFVLIKRTDTTSNWTILDFQREGYNVDNDPLYPNLSNAEGTTDLADLLSNGFKLRTTDASVNASGGTYIYMSLASNPFKYSLGR